MVLASAGAEARSGLVPGRVQPRAPRQQGQEGFLNGHRVSRAVLRKTAVCSKTPYDHGLFLANLKERRWVRGHAARS